MNSNLLTYWRSSLIDSQRTSPVLNDATCHILNIGALAQGMVAQDIAHKIIKQRQDLLKRQVGQNLTKRQEEEIDAIKTASVLITPFIVTTRVEHGVGHSDSEKTRQGSVWISATLSLDGKLSADANRPPWFERACLEPIGLKTITLGTIENLDKFLEQTTFSTDPSFPDVLKFADNLCKAVANTSIYEPKFEHYSTQHGRIMLFHEHAGAGESIVRFCEAIRDNPEEWTKNTALNTLLAEHSHQQSATHSFEPESTARHTGHIGQHILAPTQREAMANILSTGSQSILAVNGPPGTGKTTLMQSVIASGVVNSALAGEAPFVALACSTNNQAVTNLIDSLGKALLQNSPDPLSRRWIPQARSLGLFFPSDKAKERIPKGKYLMAARKGGTFPDEIENTETRAQTEQHFFECFSHYYGKKIEDPANIIEILHGHLKTQFGRYTKIISTLGQLTDIRQALKDSRFADLAEWINSLETETLKQQEILSACQKAADEENRLAAAQEKKARDLRKAALAEIQPNSLIKRLLNLLPDNKQLSISKLQFMLIDNGYEQFAEKLSQPNFRLPQAMRIFDRLVIDATRLGQSPEAATQISTLQANIADLQAQTAQLKKWLSFRIECWNEIAELINKINTETCAATFEYQNSETLRTQYKNNPESLIEKLDKLVRNRLFFLASRYWEARWINENRNIDANTDLKQTAEHISKRLRRYAMLTPCFVATCYKATATFLVPYKGPLKGFFDMIIMDEAGQVAPEVGGPCLILGQKAIIIGDTLQIAPIVSVSSAIDRGNLHEAGLLEHETILAQNGYTAFEGSMMKMAQHKSCFTLPDNKGMFLAEHRRCYDEIIHYCNRFYNGRLTPLRGTKTESLLPAMGYAHIRGAARKIEGSWSNKIEAQTIADWIARQQAKLEAAYKEPIEKIIAIVTPFRSQANLIRNELAKQANTNGVSGLRNITVGTVHGLQGAECPVVIFSTVYDFTVSTQYFFNSDNSMLNVAVSRAQDSFLVFGDMQIFDASTPPRTNSDYLAHIILADPENEITDILPTTLGIDPTILPLRLETLQQHREYLKKSFETAKNNILIYSRYLSDKAINDDEIINAIEAANRRGVKVVIAACADHFIPCNKTEKDYAKKAREILLASPAELLLLPRIHNKTLIVDDRHLIDGSFNWFSAPRNAAYDKQEFSNAYSGDDIGDTIHRVWQRTLERIPDQSERQRIRQLIFP